METITYNTIMFELPIDYISIKECCITEKINEHTSVRIVGLLTEEEQINALEQVTLDSIVHIYTEEKKLFHGIATKFEIRYQNGVGEFVLCAVDESIQLDIIKKSRSFQDINKTYADIIKQIVHSYSGDFANASRYTMYPQAPLIQYDETDWEFIKRLTSYMGTYLQPEAKREGIQLYLGEHVGYTHTPEIYEFVEKNENHIYVTKQDNGYKTRDKRCKSIWITTAESYDMGDKIENQEELYTIIEKTSQMEKEQMLFTYRMRKNEDILVSVHHNKQIKGVSIEGTILAINDDKLKLHLCIDETQEEETAYPYPLAVPYTAEGNTGWYMMPQIGEKAFLYIPSGDESEAYISTVMHSEGESNSYMVEESVHSIGTEDDKSLVMNKDDISFQSENNEFYITMMENEGISIVSDEDIKLMAGKNGSIESKKIKMYAKDRITLTTKKTSIIMDIAVDISGDNQRKSVADQLMYSFGANSCMSGHAYGNDISKTSYNRDEDEKNLTEANDRLNKSYPLEDPYKIIREYLDGNRKEIEADRAVQTLASKIKKDLKKYKTNLNGNYQQYDVYIKGWVDYFNKSRKDKIDPEVIKAMLYKETKIGLYKAKSPNANSLQDVMQCLDPRNPPVYEFANIDSKQGSLVYVHNDKYKYVLLKELGYKPNKPNGKHAHKVTECLFKLKNKKYYYQYSESTPFLSIGLGVYWYGYQLDRVIKNTEKSIQKINNEWGRKYEKKYIAAGVYNIGDIKHYIPDVKKLVEEAKDGSDFDEIS